MTLPRILLLLASLPLAAQRPPAAQQLNYYSMEKEARLGAQLAEEVRANSSVLESPQILRYVESMASRLSAAMPTVGLNYSFEVLGKTGGTLHEPSVLPGGYIFVPVGLFFAAQDEAEFAGMLAHSIAHASARHGTRVATRGQLANLASVPLIFMGGRGGIHGSDSAVPLGFLPFIRGFELEADCIAVQAMVQSAYDPSALLRYVERLQVDDDRPQSPLPRRGVRIAELEQRIAEIATTQTSSASGEFERIRSVARDLAPDIASGQR